jgi:hypothetical protein
MNWPSLLNKGVELGIIDKDCGIKNDKTFLYVLKELVDQNDETKLFDFFAYVCRWGSYEQMITVADFVDCRSNNDEAFILTCTTTNDEPRKIQFFINLGVDVNTRDGEALANAIANCLLNTSRLLLENGAIMTDTVKKMFIQYHGWSEIWELFYEFGIEPHNIVTPYSSNPVVSNFICILRIMYKNGVDINSIIYESEEDHRYIK